MSATNSKAESQKIKQNHAAPPFSAGTGADPKRAFSIQEEDSPLDEKTAQIQQKQTLSIRGSISWSSGKYGLLRNAPVHRSHQVQAVGAPCDPSNKSNDADVGILGCDPGFVCQENPSRDGDYYCVADNALHSSRKLDDVFEGDCDYSDYNEGTGLGTVVCTYPDVCGEYGLPENTCARLIVTSTFDNPDDVYDYDAEACYNLFEGEYDADGDIVKMCYVPDGDSCSTSVNGEKCKTCTINEIDDGGNRTDYGGSGSTCVSSCHNLIPFPPHAFSHLTSTYATRTSFLTSNILDYNGLFQHMCGRYIRSLCH